MASISSSPSCVSTAADSVQGYVAQQSKKARWLINCIHADGFTAEEMATLPASVKNLEVMDGEMNFGRQYQLSFLETLLARSTSHLLTIARNHAHLVIPPEGKHIRIINLSDNPIFYDWQPIWKGEEQELAPSAIISFACHQGDLPPFHFLVLQIRALDPDLLKCDVETPREVPFKVGEEKPLPEEKLSAVQSREAELKAWEERLQERERALGTLEEAMESLKLELIAQPATGVALSPSRKPRRWGRRKQLLKGASLSPRRRRSPRKAHRLQTPAPAGPSRSQEEPVPASAFLEEGVCLQANAVMPLVTGCWDWPLSREEKKALLIMFDRSELMMQRNDVAQELASVQKDVY